MIWGKWERPIISKRSLSSSTTHIYYLNIITTINSKCGQNLIITLDKLS
ncbi:hypothetical protein MANES_12G103375v8 [Manihot esculenta]|uniref:Uncharacterized protein n=1 Tax=Manihot esculenta TaxID=3983 RepID=A0ACB7GQD0_MANES|nr:hypothetical protein MANES_12G103375v8 [Manihot esculenta]